jgi:hypothetical protein
MTYQVQNNTLTVTIPYFVVEDEEGAAHGWEDNYTRPLTQLEQKAVVHHYTLDLENLDIDPDTYTSDFEFTFDDKKSTMTITVSLIKGVDVPSIVKEWFAILDTSFQRYGGAGPYDDESVIVGLRALPEEDDGEGPNVGSLPDFWEAVYQDKVIAKGISQNEVCEGARNYLRQHPPNEFSRSPLLFKKNGKWASLEGDY